MAKKFVFESVERFLLKFLLLAVSLIYLFLFSLPDENLHLVFCNVGQGDAILVSYKNTQVLIDGGPDERVIDCLSAHLPFWDKKIEMVVLTHPQSDHMTGLIFVLKRYKVKYFVINKMVNDTEVFWEFQKVLLAEKAKIYHPQAGDRVRLGKIHFDIIWPREKLENETFWDLNDTSIVLKLSFGNFCAFFPGDISTELEAQLERVKPCHVLKVAHHGGGNSTSKEFLEKIRPKLAIISVGKNSFGHPNKEVIVRLKKLGIKILRTDEHGEIEITTNGQEFALTHKRSL